MRLDRSQAETLLQRMEGRKVAVLGDVMLDEYLFGEVNRISPEAPVPIVRVLKERSVLGGAANVAANLKALGTEPLLIGTLQKDVAGDRLLGLLTDLGISISGLVLDASRPTIIKTRVIGQQQQMLRIDREDPGMPEAAVLLGLKDRLERALASASALIVSDYNKGAVNAPVMEAVRSLCAERNLPWIVDPKPGNKALYRGATLMTPNTKETSELTARPARSDMEVTVAGRALMAELELRGLLVTRSERGMALFSPDAEHAAPWMIPTEAREVFDVSGAGDTVIAAFSAAIAAGADWREAAMLANAAAGVVVAKVGTATVTPAELLEHYREQEAN
ncbi:D-glycero-beta-D-manno-heptose-7-phosphate kinase [Geothrix sp. PMB-07]|uniref:D-glycero-beta-D-manno-heptose-7-phosphate kinase n=1 Tax=Geothrix sp. PMB-07 TaxID=3068640 RepID=UPI00274159F1|nr:D-glycero-beta-D-manno-heptose-7-phosphate kinase [Geothrix sp. PMB-07]WLT31076.1 D-glycero-beta-D-manno-heptose-7-phosphate kinase [Geothrix sp. PMB-07]